MPKEADRQGKCHHQTRGRGPWSGLWNVRQRQKTAQPHRQESPSSVKLYTSAGSTPLVSPLAFLLRGEPHAALLVRVSAVDSGFCILLARWLSAAPRPSSVSPLPPSLWLPSTSSHLSLSLYRKPTWRKWRNRSPRNRAWRTRATQSF